MYRLSFLLPIFLQQTNESFTIQSTHSTQQQGTMARRSARTATAAAAEPAEAKAAAPARASRKKAAAAATDAKPAEEKPRAKRGRPAKAVATTDAAAEAKAVEPKAKKPRAAKAAAAEKSKGEEAGAVAAGLVVGDAAPAFCVKNHDEQDVSLADLAGKKVVVYFYPRDDTPGCTAEGKRFTQLHDEFAALNTVVIGVSADKTASHKKFRSKYGFPFALLADTSRDMIRAYGAVKEGNKIKRSTVLIDEQGHVVKHWSSVRGAAQHPDEVLAFIQSSA